MAYLLMNYVSQNSEDWKSETRSNSTLPQKSNSIFHFTPFIGNDLSISRVIKEMSTTIKNHSSDQIKVMIQATIQLTDELSGKKDRNTRKFLQ